MPSALLRHAARGPHPVGVVTLDLADPADPGRRLPTDVWYPAAAEVAARPHDAPHVLSQPHAAVLAAPHAEGAFPVVGFSHGNSGLRHQSTFLTTHLASWGLVVAAPDHTGNTFPEMARVRDGDERIRVHRRAREDRPRDLAAAIAAACEHPNADAERVAVLGHSFGGWTALKMPAREQRLKAVCGLAPASEPFVGKRAFAPGELPFPAAVPTLLVAGIDDVLVDLETSVLPLYERLAAPRALVGVRGADHFHFCDAIPLLHGMHEANPREQQPRPTLPYAETVEEARMHALLCGLVTDFLLGSLAGENVASQWDGPSLAGLDPAVERIDPNGQASGSEREGARP